MWLGSDLIGVVLPSETPSIKPDNWYQEPFFLVCSVVAALSDLPHQKRFGFYFFLLGDLSLEK